MMQLPFFPCAMAMEPLLLSRIAPHATISYLPHAMTSLVLLPPFAVAFHHCL